MKKITIYDTTLRDGMQGIEINYTLTDKIEIAHKLKISESTVNNHLVTILKFLKSHIDSRLAVNVLFICLFLS